MDQYDGPQDLHATSSVTKIYINKKGKRQIEDLITSNYSFTFPTYCDKVGISPSNFYATLNGTRACTTEFLNKLLSGIGYQVTVETKLILHPLDVGEPAPIADYLEHDNESFLNDEEETDEYD